MSFFDNIGSGLQSFGSSFQSGLSSVSDLFGNAAKISQSIGQLTGKQGGGTPYLSGGIAGGGFASLPFFGGKTAAPAAPASSGLETSTMLLLLGALILIVFLVAR
jgi:hypothetical protein